jgi:hypothetical protein
VDQERVTVITADGLDFQRYIFVGFYPMTIVPPNREGVADEVYGTGGEGGAENDVRSARFVEVIQPALHQRSYFLPRTHFATITSPPFSASP